MHMSQQASMRAAGHSSACLLNVGRNGAVACFETKSGAGGQLSELLLMNEFATAVAATRRLTLVTARVICKAGDQSTGCRGVQAGSIHRFAVVEATVQLLVEADNAWGPARRTGGCSCYTRRANDDRHVYLRPAHLLRLLRRGQRVRPTTTTPANNTAPLSSISRPQAARAAPA
jgi:hypothetical protein